MRKRWIPVLLVLALLAGMLSATAMAEGAASAASQLYLRDVEMMFENNSVSYTETDTVRTELTTNADRGFPVQFFMDEACEKAVLEAPVSSDPTVVAISEEGAELDGAPIWHLDTKKPGTAQVTATHKGKTYAMTVTVKTPDFGFSTLPQMTNSSYITSLSFVGEDLPALYFVSVRDQIFDVKFRNDNADYFTAEISDDGHYVSIYGKPGVTVFPGELRADFQVGGSAENARYRTYSLPLQQTVPSLAAVCVDEDRAETAAVHSLSFQVGDTASLAMYQLAGDTKTALPGVTRVAVSNRNILSCSIGPFVTDKGNAIVDVEALAAGMTELTVTYENGKTMTASVVVAEEVSMEETSVLASKGGYVVGFGMKNGDVLNLFEGPMMLGMPGNVMPGNAYGRFHDARIFAAVKSVDAQGAVTYKQEENMPVSFQVKKAWLQNRSGDPAVFSFSQSQTQRVKTDFASGTQFIPLFSRMQIEQAILFAEIELTVNGETSVEIIRTGVGMNLTDDRVIDSAYIAETLGDVSPADVDVEHINEVLAMLPSMPSTDITSYVIQLDAKEYTGVIKMPDADILCTRIHFLVNPRAMEKAVLNGGLDLNGKAVHVRGIAFRARQTDTSAIYNGTAINVEDCVFYNYPLACDGTEGIITLTGGNLFVNNDVAALVDAKEHEQGNRAHWVENTFINNGTAVQVKSFGAFLSSWYFRITDCNFINNGTDLDIQDKGTVYLYNNYFGHLVKRGGKNPTPGRTQSDRNNGRDDLRLDEILAARTEGKLETVVSSRAPRTEKGKQTRIVTNPRWKYPVLDWWRSRAVVSDAVFGPGGVQPIMTLDTEPDYVNILISDWGETTTEIINDEAGDLLLNAEAFDFEGDKEITVVNADASETIELLGTWSFD